MQEGLIIYLIKHHVEEDLKRVSTAANCSGQKGGESFPFRGEEGPNPGERGAAAAKRSRDYEKQANDKLPERPFLMVSAFLSIPLIFPRCRNIISLSLTITIARFVFSSTQRHSGIIARTV